ncbi:hypothetical protein ETAA8_06710 [Anatilimnocola aggregata]|uniref:Uncharacterized protein n=1 Tax=Anatilimnocola aggregata TaxID=2528021 RepID=A0A517Y5T6_9BACT|nr:hypothetical protein ETAA8_06710 [Anatilimnocola aggregata]
MSSMYTTEPKPNEDDLRLRAHILLLIEKLGFCGSECSIDTYLGVVPIDRFTLRFPGGSATGSYQQLVEVLSSARTTEQFVANCWATEILD